MAPIPKLHRRLKTPSARKARDGTFRAITTHFSDEKSDSYIIVKVVLILSAYIFLH